MDYVFLEARSLVKRFGGITAVDRISFEVSSGQIKAIIGPNGSGKTTVFNLIMCNYSLDEGDIFFKGKPLNGLNPYEVARLGISRTFQNVRLFEQMTVVENVMTGMHCRTQCGLTSAVFSQNRARLEERMIYDQSIEILDLIGLRDKEDFRASSLPYGEQKLLEIARAMATKPELLLLDEPASGLNLSEIEKLISLIRKIRDKGMTIILIDHQMGLILDISDEVLVLNYGKKIAEGTPSEISSDQDVVSAYLGMGAVVA